jgi:hypothetical protein
MFDEIRLGYCCILGYLKRLQEVQAPVCPFDLAAYRQKLILIEDKCQSLRKHNYLYRAGYGFIRRTGLNSWYIPKEGARCAGSTPITSLAPIKSSAPTQAFLSPQL